MVKIKDRREHIGMYGNKPFDKEIHKKYIIMKKLII